MVVVVMVSARVVDGGGCRGAPALRRALGVILRNLSFWGRPHLFHRGPRRARLLVRCPPGGGERIHSTYREAKESGVGTS